MSSRVSFPSDRRESSPSALEEILTACRKVAGGSTAKYIPELASVDPDLFGIAMCSVDGSIEHAGDADVPFTIQSLCKPFLYAMALAQFGSQRVHERVGVEPTGQEFNSFMRLEAGSKRPRNPMVNAGAIAIIDLLTENLAVPAGSTRWPEEFAGLAGCDALEVDPKVYESERDHAVRNRVIAYLMKHFGMVAGDVESVLDRYFEVCSMKVTCRNLAVMAGCLATGGVHPVTGTRIWTREVVSNVLTVMTTCGAYDSSGRFAYEVGLPAKSGVSGGIIAVEPGRYGLAVFSPPIDRDGNSVRGSAALRRFSRQTRAHCFDVRSKPAVSVHPPDLHAVLTKVHATAPERAEGALEQTGEDQAASYLPPVDPSLFGMAICTVDGREAQVGDADAAFTMQALANPIAFAFALQRFGARAIRRIVGVEPSGNPFHAIVIDHRNMRPYNPLGNAGALAVAGLNSTDPSWNDRVGSCLAQGIGDSEPMGIDPEVLAAEHRHGNRNRAIANLLSEVGVLADVDAALDAYFRQCSCLTTGRNLARLAATLANGGVSPFTGRRIFRREVVRSTLTVMYTCGMHDQSGRFALDVGVPAKSGVSGGILAVSPGRMGISVYSPIVDESGTSVRGRNALRELSSILELGILGPGRAARDERTPLK